LRKKLRAILLKQLFIILPKIIELVLLKDLCQFVITILCINDSFQNGLVKMESHPAVHVHVPYKAGLIALWLKKNYNLNYYVTEHWTGYDKTKHRQFFL
jgi:hypothetical protein